MLNYKKLNQVFVLAAVIAVPSVSMADGNCRPLSGKQLIDVLGKTDVSLAKVHSDLDELETQLVTVSEDARAKAKALTDLAFKADQATKGLTLADPKLAGSASQKIVEIRGMLARLGGMLKHADFLKSTQQSRATQLDIEGVINATHPALVHYNCVFEIAKEAADEKKGIMPWWKVAALYREQEAKDLTAPQKDQLPAAVVTEQKPDAAIAKTEIIADAGAPDATVHADATLAAGSGSSSGSAAVGSTQESSQSAGVGSGSGSGSGSTRDATLSQ